MCFNVNLRRYTEALRAHPALLALAPAAALLGFLGRDNQILVCYAVGAPLL